MNSLSLRLHRKCHGGVEMPVVKLVSVIGRENKVAAILPTLEQSHSSVWGIDHLQSIHLSIAPYAAFSAGRSELVSMNKYFAARVDQGLGHVYSIIRINALREA